MRLKDYHKILTFEHLNGLGHAFISRVSESTVVLRPFERQNLISEVDLDHMQYIQQSCVFPLQRKTSVLLMDLALVARITFQMF